MGGCNSIGDTPEYGASMSIIGGKDSKSSLKGCAKFDAGLSPVNTQSRVFDFSQFGSLITSTVERRAIEPRILLDAAAGETAEMIAGEVAEQQAAEWAEAISQTFEKETDEAAALNFESIEIVFIDAGVEGYQTIVEELGPDIEIVIIDSNSNGVEQIADHLVDRSNVSAIHIISHGSSGTLNLGDAKLTSASIKGEYADDMVIIKNALSHNADILIYGCDFGAGLRGANAVNALVNATGADVAASDDLTGAAILGGDWDLEISKGTIETNILGGDEFAGILAENSAPTLDLDTSNSTTTGNNYEATFTENGLPINIAGSDTVVNDLDGNISAITITLTSGKEGDLIGTPEEMPGGITFEATPSGFLEADGLMTIYLVGNADTTNADWSLLLQRLTLLPSTKFADNPDATDRIFNFVVTDVEGAKSAISTSIIHIQQINDPASLDLDADDSSVNTLGGYNGYFIENSGGAPLHTDMVIIDFDSENLVSARVTFNNPLVDDQLIIDGVLVFDQGDLVETSGLANDINYTTAIVDGRLVISFDGIHSKADYTSALESISFNNTSDDMNLTVRTFETVINDGGQESSPRTSFINMLERNDAPTPLNNFGATDEVTPLSLTPLDNDSDIEGHDLFISAIDGLAIGPGETVTLPSGAHVTLNSDGSIIFDPRGAFDALGTGAKTVETFTYTVTDNGQSPTPAADGSAVANPDSLSKNGIIQITISGLIDPVLTFDNRTSLTEDDNDGVSGNVVNDDDGFGTDGAIDNRGRSTLYWEDVGDGTDITSTPQLVGGVTISVSVTGVGTPASNHATTDHGQLGGHNGYLVLAQQNSVDNSGGSVDTTFDFDQPVEDLKFQILDLDADLAGLSQDQITVLAYNESGELLPVEILANTAFLTQNGETFLGLGQEVPNEGSQGNLFVDIKGPVSKIVIQLKNGVTENATNTGLQTVGISDFDWSNITENALEIIDFNGVTDVNKDIVGNYGSLNWQSDGTYTYTLDPNNAEVQALYDGETPLRETFTYTARDEYGQTSQSTLTVDITGLNDAPQIHGPSVYNEADDTYTIPDFNSNDLDQLTNGLAVDLTTIFYDVDNGSVLSFNLMGLPTGLSVDENGLITGIIDSAASSQGSNNDGVFAVTVVVSDGIDSITVKYNWVIKETLPHVEEPAHEINLPNYLETQIEVFDQEDFDLTFLNLINDIDPLAAGTGLFDLNAPIGEAINKIQKLDEKLNLNAEGFSISQVINWIEKIRLELGMDPEIDSMGFKRAAYLGGDNILSINGQDLSLLTLGTKDRLLLQLQENYRFYDIEIESVDGRAIPSWVESYDETLVVFTKPAGQETINIVLNASGVNGNEFKIQFNLDFFTGTIKLSDASSAYLHQGFSGQLMALNNAPSNEISQLLDKLG